MAKVYITEYARASLDTRAFIPSGEEPSIKCTVLDTTATHTSAVLDKNTRLVRVHTDGIISYKFGTAPVAATTDSRMAANATEYFGIPPIAAGTAIGTLEIDVIANT